MANDVLIKKLKNLRDYYRERAAERNRMSNDLERAHQDIRDKGRVPDEFAVYKEGLYRGWSDGFEAAARSIDIQIKDLESEV